MRKNLDVWQDERAEQEGGFNDRPRADDPGGPTNRGITLATLAEVRNREVTIDELKALTEDEARAIAANRYWRPAGCDQLPGGVDIAVADMAYNSGPHQAVLTLQRTLGFVGNDLDGDIGPATLGAARKRDPGELIDLYCDARLTFMAKLKNWDANQNGWTKRVAAIRALAHDHAEAIAPIPSAKPMAESRIAWGSIASGGVAAAGAIGVAVDQAKSVQAPLGQVLSTLGIDPSLALGVGFILIMGASVVTWLARRDDHRKAKEIEAAS